MDILAERLEKLFFICLDWVVNTKLTNIDKNGLVIVRLDAIGDFILWLDSAKEYRRLYPEQKITLIANKAWADLALKLPFWDDVWPVDLRLFQHNLPYRIKMLSKIRHAGFEIAIQPTYSRELLFGDSVIRATGSLKRIGSIGNLSNISRFGKAICDAWYTHLLPVENEPLMELDRNAEFMMHLSGQEYTTGLPKLPKLSNLPEHLELTSDYFIIFPGASKIEKQWPIVSFSACLDELSKQYRWRAVLCGVASEYEVCQSVIDHSNTANSINLAGKTSLPEFAEVIRGARLLISNDTSAIHIAVAVDTPSVCILGGGHFGRFMPYSESIEGIKPVAVFSEMDCFGCNWQCSQPHENDACVPCISRVSVNSVLDGVATVLQRS